MVIPVLLKVNSKYKCSVPYSSEVISEVLNIDFYVQNSHLIKNGNFLQWNKTGSFKQCYIKAVRTDRQRILLFKASLIFNNFQEIKKLGEVYSPHYRQAVFLQACPRFFVPLRFAHAALVSKNSFSSDSLPYQHKAILCVRLPQLHSSWLPFIHVHVCTQYFYIYFLNYQN